MPTHTSNQAAGFNYDHHHCHESAGRASEQRRKVPAVKRSFVAKLNAQSAANARTNLTKRLMGCLL